MIKLSFQEYNFKYKNILLNININDFVLIIT